MLDSLGIYIAPEPDTLVLLTYLEVGVEQCPKPPPDAIQLVLLPRWANPSPTPRRVRTLLSFAPPMSMYSQQMCVCFEERARR